MRLSRLDGPERCMFASCFLSAFGRERIYVQRRSARILQRERFFNENKLAGTLILTVIAQ